MTRVILTSSTILILVNFVSFIVCATKDVDLFTSKKGKIVYFDKGYTDEIHIRCFNKNELITDVFPVLQEAKSVKSLLLVHCELPPKPLKEVFDALRINATALEEIDIVILDSEYELPEANYTEGLTIKTLSVSSDSPVLLRRNKNIFKPLLNLTKLAVAGNGLDLPYLPSSAQLEELWLDGVVFDSWGGCQYLKNLTIKGLSTVIPTAWPENCNILEKLHLEEIKPEIVQQLVHNISVNDHSLRHLTIRDCALQELSPVILNATTDLHYLDLTRNGLTDDECSKFPVLNSSSIIFGDNELTSACLRDLAPKIPSVRYLKFNGNNFAPRFSPGLKKVLERLEFLEEFHLEDMAMGTDCLEDAHFQNLKLLNLASFENIKHLHIHEFPGTSSSNLTVDLRRRNVLRSSTEESKESWFKKNNETTLTLLVNGVDCDCENADLVYALKEHRDHFSMPFAKCTNTDRELLNEPLENMECLAVILEGCLARWRSKEEAWTKLDCADRQLEEIRWNNILRSFPNPISLNISGNYLTSIEGAKFPDSIEWIDLRNNHISRLSKEEVSQLLSTRKRRVWLNGNPLVCDCRNRDLLDVLQDKKKQVLDYDQIKCSDSGSPLLHLVVKEVKQFCSQFH